MFVEQREVLINYNVIEQVGDFFIVLVEELIMTVSDGRLSISLVL